MSNNKDFMLKCLRNNQEEFKLRVSEFLQVNNVIEFINQCTDYEKDFAIKLCSDVSVCLIHKIFEKVELVESVLFLETKQEQYKQKKFFLDSEERTWLHIAVIFNRNINILNFLINSIKIKISSKDIYHLTPLHLACQKDKCYKEEIFVLMKEENQLIIPTLDGSTALEFLCQREENIQYIEDVDLERLLKKVDKVSKGTLMVESTYINKNLQIDKLWMNILRKNDKYFLILHIQKDENFDEKYYLEQNDMISIIRNCNENGRGILTFIKKTYFCETNENICFKRIFKDLTGIKIKERNDKYSFHRSSLFLCLLTGRFELLEIMLQYTQFEIIPNALLVSLLCKKLSVNSTFSFQIVEEIQKLKNFCELYIIKVVNRTSNKDLSLCKSVITKYIATKSEKLDNKSLLDIAHKGSCDLFLSLPVCQQSLDNIWKSGKIKSPIFKFYIHSAFHITFLILFSYMLVVCLYAKITPLEITCYLYCVGYTCQEIRQIYFYIRDDSFLSYCRHYSNFIDILAIIFMTIGMLARISVKMPRYHANETETLYKESKELNVFIVRMFFCISLILFYMKVLYFASVFEVFGPKLKMIGKMIIKDLLPLLLFFSIFIVSFGVAFQVLLFPNMYHLKSSSDSRTNDKKTHLSTFGDILRRPTFSIFDAGYTLDEIEHENMRDVTHFKERYIIYLMLLVFVVVTNVMLMNLLIALFSYTVTIIVQESNVSWKSNRYTIINEYFAKTVLPPPFNIFGDIIDIIKRICKRTNKRRPKNDFNELDFIVNTSDRELKNDSFISYYILQSLAISNHRYKLMKNDRDDEYEAEHRMKEMEKLLKDIYNKTCNTSDTM